MIVNCNNTTSSYIEILGKKVDTEIICDAKTILSAFYDDNDDLNRIMKKLIIQLYGEDVYNILERFV